MRKTYLVAIAFITLLVAATVARAEVNIMGTRVIYDEKQREGVVKISNTGNTPVLLQAWIDNGDANAQPDTIKVPFSVTPPVVRLDPKRNQTIRLFRTGEGLAVDRETLFWFNLLEIPPKPTKKAVADENKLQLAFRTRIKMFYRPVELTLPIEQAIMSLTFSKIGNQLVIKNSSPYYISFRKLELRASKDSPVVENLSKINSKMIAPFTELSLQMRASTAIDNTTQVFYSVINDQGGETLRNQKLVQ